MLKDDEIGNMQKNLIDNLKMDKKLRQTMRDITHHFR